MDQNTQNVVLLLLSFLDNLQKGVNNFEIEHKIANLVVGGAVPP